MLYSGLNLRTGEKGIFPLAHVVDVDYNDIYCAGEEEKKERYLLDYLGSVQCAHKGSDIIVQVMMSLKTHSVLLFSSWFLHHCDTEFLLQAVTKMTSRVENGQKTTCILEISDKGIKMVDKSKPGVIIQTTIFINSDILCLQDGNGGVPCHEYFFRKTFIK